MDRRTHEGPMDFEYQNGTGPMDGRSPFAQISMNQQRSTNGGGSDNSAKKRGIWTAFGSPGKSSIPSLREPASQPHLFTTPNLPPSPTKPLPPTPFSMRNNPLFSTPRRLNDDLASSGGETPKSPEHNNDSDATPGDTTNFRSVAAKFDQATMPSFTAGSTTISPKKEKRRDSWWSRAAGFVNSPGRGEVPRGVYSDKIVKRVEKKRSRDARKQLARVRRDSVSDSEVEEQLTRPTSRKTSRTNKDAAPPAEEKGPHYLYTFFDFLESHPRLPWILSWYAQLALNIFCFSAIAYGIWTIWATIRSDVDKKSNEAIQELLAEMAACAQQYTENRCARDTRVPAMEVVCNNWDKCMNRDPKSVGKARVSAHTFAEIFNSFLEPISWKAMIFSVILVFGAIALSNLPFSMFRERAAANNAAAAVNHHYYGNGMPPPPTPQRQFSGPENGYWTPYHNEQPAGIEPAASGFPQIEGQGSPVKRLNFR